MGGGSKQPKIPPGGGFGRGRGGVQFLYIFLEGGGIRATWNPLWLHPCRLPYIFAIPMHLNRNWWDILNHK